MVLCYDDSDKVTQIGTNPQVNVAFSDTKNGSWTSVSGTAAVVRDRAQMERLWAAPLEVWFPDGLDTDGIALIKVHADSAEWWESSSSKAVQLVDAVRAAATGDPDKLPGDNAETKL